MAKLAHLSLRSGIWYWRRRCPRALPCGDHRTTYEMSLRTGDRRTAIRRALALDLALEEVMLMEVPPPGLTIRTLMVNLRNELVLEGEMERASRPTAPSAAFGTPPASNPTGLAESSLADLMALSEMPSVPDEDLIEEHPLGRRSSGDAPAAGASTATDGVLPPDLATPARRAAFFAGLCHYMTQAVRRNDLELADGVVECESAWNKGSSAHSVLRWRGPQ